MTTKELDILREMQLSLTEFRNDLGDKKSNSIGFGCSDKYTLNEELGAIISARRNLIKNRQNSTNPKETNDLKEQIIEYRKKVKEYEKELSENNIVMIKGKCKEIWSKLRRISALIHKNKNSNDILKEFEEVKCDIEKYIPNQ